MDSVIHLTSNRVATCDDQGNIKISPAWITIQSNKIRSVTKVTLEDKKKKCENATTKKEKIWDLHDRLITPAFINPHTHLAMSFFRGLSGCELTKSNVISDFYFHIESKLSREDVLAFSRMGAFESLLLGVGMVWDHYYYGEQIAQAVSEVGLSAVVASTLQDVSGPGKTRLEENWQSTIDINSQKWERKGVYSAFGPHATNTVSDSLWKRISNLAEEHNRTLDYGLRVHVIVRDTEKEARVYGQCFAVRYELIETCDYCSNGRAECG